MFRDSFWGSVLAFFFAPLCIGGSSSSKSSQEYNTTDSRVAGGSTGSIAVGAAAVNASAGGIGVKAEGDSRINITETSTENFKRLLDTLDKQDALNGQSLNSLLSGVEKVVAISATQVETSKSTLDNKTLSLFAVAGVVVAAIAFKYH
jgi:hypothetical protein